MWTKKTRQTSYLWMLYGCCSAGCVFTFFCSVMMSRVRWLQCEGKKTFLNSYIIWSNKIENVLKIMPYLFYWTYLNVKNGVEYWAFEASGKFRFTHSLIHHQHLTRFWKSLLNILLHFLSSYSKSFFFRWQHDIKTCWSFINRLICILVV